MGGMSTRWLVVNNLLFCFIGNRDTTLFSARTPLGQGLQTHSSRMHHREKTKSHFVLLYYAFSLTIKRHFLMAWTHIGGLLARWHDASQPYCEKSDCDVLVMLLYTRFRRLLLSLWSSWWITFTKKLRNIGTRARTKTQMHFCIHPLHHPALLPGP